MEKEPESDGFLAREGDSPGEGPIGRHHLPKRGEGQAVASQQEVFVADRFHSKTFVAGRLRHI
jgi:hypothetical protein